MEIFVTVVFIASLFIMLDSWDRFKTMQYFFYSREQLNSAIIRIIIPGLICIVSFAGIIYLIF